MGLSRREQVLLRRIDARLERDDPRLARRIAAFAPPGAEPVEPVAWRPPRAAVVIAAVGLAAAVFLTALTVLSIGPPCRGAATGARPGASPAAEPPAPAPSGPSRTC
ncbi:DUF3040 domain-containing protein [Actinomadura rifamycini]|uniref:DUF3040 domain-containing protein n=1 Tax=Actinomadura rifamycini TaxID=31962 RepID=UPI00041D9F49|nr:DUF3040 domain-containing protein [Actinomadura rifamycini]